MECYPVRRNKQSHSHKTHTSIKKLQRDLRSSLKLHSLAEVQVAFLLSKCCTRVSTKGIPCRYVRSLLCVVTSYFEECQVGEVIIWAFRGFFKKKSNETENTRVNLLWNIDSGISLKRAWCKADREWLLLNVFQLKILSMKRTSQCYRQFCFFVRMVPFKRFYCL